MALHFAQPPEASMSALNAILPRIATRTSVATNAPNLGYAVGAALRRGQEGAPPTLAPISAPVHVLGLDQLAKGADVAKTKPKLWTHLLHGELTEGAGGAAGWDGGGGGAAALQSPMGLVSVPMPSIVSSMTSPAFIVCGGTMA